MKKILTLTLCLALLLGLFSGCGGKQYDPLAGVETTVFTDDAGRDVTVPAGITRIAASGSTAQMILMTLVPELLVGLASSPSTAQRPYFPEEMWTLPTFGQFYGSKANLNMEALIDAEPQLIVDLGDAKENVRSDMDGIQKQTGIPTVFLEATLEEMPQAYRKLGRLLHREAEAEVLAVYLEQTLAMAAENSAKLPQGAFHGRRTRARPCCSARVRRASPATPRVRYRRTCCRSSAPETPSIPRRSATATAARP